jgi:integrase
MNSSSTYLVKNRFGVYYFQRRVPLKVAKQFLSLPKLVRLSLNTKSKKEALRKVRLILVMWDLRAQEYFPDEKTYSKALHLLQQFYEVKKMSFESAQTFLDSLDDSPDSSKNLLDQAMNYANSIALENGNLQLTEELQKYDERLPQKHLENQKFSIHSISIDEAFDDFINQNKKTWEKDSTMENSYRKSYYPILKAVTGEIQTGNITKQHIVNFKKIVLNLPANKTKLSKYKNKPLTYFITASSDENDQLSPATKQKYITAIAGFLEWLKINDYSSIDLDAPLKKLKITKIEASEQRDLFKAEDLNKLFNSKEYIQGTHKKASHFWVPLIGLYTGARLNEICQLEIKDIYQYKDTGIWVFDINKNKESDPNKSLKNDGSIRIIPVHKKLIELGFIDFFKTQKNNKRLFSDLPYVNSNNKYGDNLQRWFNRTYKNRCGVTTPKTSFHSFRHTVITSLENDKRCIGIVTDYAFGHKPDKTQIKLRYGKRPDHIVHFPIFDFLDFSHAFDIEKIRHWKYHSFNRK